tara:strand:+ start:10573 stop:11571 length:999 start_codon:yes stop_codon:yes gene_type:complete
MKKVLLTGSQGFIGSYICNELLANNYEVFGIDNFSKYGTVTRSHDTHDNFTFYNLNILSDDFQSVCKEINPDIIIANAALIGGIAYFHEYAYDIISQNEQILSNTFDSAINNNIDRIIVMSSSMVYENADSYPTKESDLKKIPPPNSTYGFQKLSSEYFAKGAYEQHKIPYTIIRPFNCVGVGEEKSLKDPEIKSGNVKMLLSHVVPDLINKILSGQNPLHILGTGNQIRCYTNGKDIARGVRLAIESDQAINEDFNISTECAVSVLELAEILWNKLNPGQKFEYVVDTPYKYDVQKRIPDVSKAFDKLEFEALVSLEESLDEVIKYVKNNS